MYRFTAWAAALLGAAISTGVRADLISVGDTADCDVQITATDASAFASAVSAAQHFDVFRLAMSEITVDLEITRREIQIDGGYPTCADAEADRNQVPLGTTLIGSGERAVIRVYGEEGRNTGTRDELQFAVQPYVLTITNLRISRGGGFIGGGLEITGAASVSLIDSLVIDNRVSSSGGGVFITGQLAKLSLIRTTVTANYADLFGGGIYCTNQAVVFQDEFSSVSANQSKLDGGGVYAEACRYDGRGSIVNNSSSRNGGGLHASRGARVDLTGGTRALIVGNNFADTKNEGSGVGGGIYLEGAGTHLIAENVQILLNRAHRGGGLAATFDAKAEIRRNLSTGCADEEIQGLPMSSRAIGCSAMIANSASSTGCFDPDEDDACAGDSSLGGELGDELYVVDGARVSVSQSSVFSADPATTHFRVADEMVYVGRNAAVAFESSLLASDFATGETRRLATVVESEAEGAGLVITHSSVATRGLTPGAWIGGDGGRVLVMSSVLSAASPAPLVDVTAPGLLGETRGNLLRRVTGVSDGESRSTAIPLFVSGADWDYRLRSTAEVVSLSRDRGNDTALQGLFDLDLRPRTLGNFPDIGPNEFPSAGGDAIFASGFEGSGIPRFTDLLAGVFNHPRCKTCHTASHFEAAVTNRFAHSGQDLATCAGGCHAGTGEQDLTNWHAPRDLRLHGLSTRQACNLAQRSVGRVTARKHLTEDPLILWAVSDGEVPAGGASASLTTPATDLTTSEWVAYVDNWFDTGARCE